MKQKLAIARALLHEPPILYLDEPTAALDPEAARLVRDFIRFLREEGRTIFLSTHNLNEADHLCDRIAVFKSKLLVLDTPAELRSQVFGRKVIFHLLINEPKYQETINALHITSDVQQIDNKIIVTTENPEQNNPVIIQALVNAGAEIQFVGELRRSLEDVYLQLVQNT
jgi:ABC-2 type transport system ATP-binding protein